MSNKDIKSTTEDNNKDNKVQGVKIKDSKIEAISANSDNDEQLEVQSIDSDEAEEINKGHIDNTKKPVKAKRKKKKSIIPIKVQKYLRWAVMLISFCIFVYCAYSLTKIQIEYKEGKDTYSDLSDMFIVPDVSAGEDATNANGETIELSNSSSGKWVWDFQKLLDQNPDSKGWIKQNDGEYINYPVVQASADKDNEYYLRRTIYHKSNVVGTIFIDQRSKEGFDSRNCIIYGHKMHNYTMFGSLQFYFDKSSYCKENPDMDIYAGEKHYKYYVFAVYKTPEVGSPVYQFDYANDEVFLDYIKEARERSVYNFKNVGEIKADDHIITLSTCTTEEDQRLIVQLVRREEINDSAEE